MLLEHRADVNCQDDNGKTPLHILFERWAYNEDKTLNHARLLLEHGAEANRPDKNNQMPLHLAMEHIWFKLARLFLEHGADANAENNNGETPLDLALDMLLVVSEGQIRDGDVLDFIWLLLEHGAEVNRRGKTHQTPLLLAMERDWFKLALVLLEHGADPNASNNIGKTPLHILSECQIYDKSGVGDVLLNHVGLWREHGAGRYKGNGTPLLLDIGTQSPQTPWAYAPRIEPEDVQDEDHTTPSHSESNFSPDIGPQTPWAYVPRILEDVQDEDHTTPSHSESNFGPVETAEAPVPLDQGADTNAWGDGGETSLNQELEGTYVQNENPFTPLPLAPSYRTWSLDIVSVPLYHGATANSEDNFGRTPLYPVAEGAYSFEQDRVRVAQLLLECGADVNATDEDSTTPLHLASCYGRVEIARVLLDGGATINSKGNQGRTPLHVVAGGYYSKDIGGVPVAQLLLGRGADINMPDDDNQTPLHLASSLASYFGRVEMVLVLLNAGANASAQNAKGQTPLHLVSLCPHYSRGDAVGVAQLLLERGADVNAQDKNHATPSDLASYHGRTEITSLLGHQQNYMLLAALDPVPLLSCPTCFTKNH
ncbi:ankyrin repeat-containing domain protein [Lactarius akahatsu]|uniref:Ankyrin repeat-containing domain protein n=1 Tax=Lactarius akahatsu TaxID=416441 RepID=A0AAD4LJI7_9AGAM|nr:ankyrin repeat-containing domain protein [Lactarius akahatsu]